MTSKDGDANRHAAPLAAVTGAANGIGRSFAQQLAKRGYRLVLIDRDKTALKALAQELAHASHFEPLCFAVDVAEPAAWDAISQKLEKQVSPLALLVNCAGILLSGPLVESDAEQLNHLLRVNLFGTLLGCRAMGPHLLRAQSASMGQPALPRGVLNVASIFAAVTPPSFAAYNASKAGVVALTETLRGEWASGGLTATVVLPGVTPTGLFERAIYTDQRVRGLVDRYLSQAELTSDSVAEASLRAYAGRQLVVPIGRRASRYAWLKRWLPTLVTNAVARRTAKELEGSSISAERP